MSPYRYFLIAAVALSLQARAQTTDAVCLADQSPPWENNSKGQSSCLVASYLRHTCNQDASNIPVLPEGKIYSTPSKSNATPCICSSVYYNLISECSLCQDRSVTTWPRWITNCTGAVTVSIAKWPMEIPDGTAIPAWALYDPTAKGIFNRDDAGVLASQPDLLPSNNSTPQGSSSSVNVGAIAGGVVGGVVLIGLIACGIFFYLRRKRANTGTTYIQETPMKDPAMAPMIPYSGGSWGTPTPAPYSTTTSPAPYSMTGSPAPTYSISTPTPAPDYLNPNPNGVFVPAAPVTFGGPAQYQSMPGKYTGAAELQ